jgi:hypothetical protein
MGQPPPFGQQRDWTSQITVCREPAARVRNEGEAAALAEPTAASEFDANCPWEAALE